MHWTVAGWAPCESFCVCEPTIWMTNIFCRNFMPFSSLSFYSHSLCSFDYMLHFHARNKVQMSNKAIKNDIVDGHKIHGNSCGLINHAHHPIPVALCSVTLFVFFGKIDSVLFLALIIHFLCHNVSTRNELFFHVSI